MKKIFGWLVKCVAAGILAVLVLSIFSMVYYHPPIAIEQPDGSTNFKYIPNAGWTFMLEGFGYGKTDTLGYNNAYYTDCTAPDLVLAGSSHMEALNVAQDENCVYLLNEMLDTDGVAGNDYKCLNLGISGHFFEVTASNYPYIAERYKGAKYVVLEVPEVKYSASMLDGMLAGEYRAPLEKKGILYETAQRIPFFRVMYKKLNETLSAKAAPIETAGVAAAEADNLQVYSEKMNAVLANIAALSSENGIKPIVLLHERFWEDKDGLVHAELDADYKAAFKACCAQNGIDVIDVLPAMLTAYEENHTFSYGFANTTPGEGHLNETGHRIIAECLYNYLIETEAAK